MNKIKLILFDIGGVFIDFKNVFKTASSEQKIPLELIDQTFDKYDSQITKGKITAQELWTKLIEENGLIAYKNYDFLKSWLKDYIKINQTFELANKLGRNYDLGILSNIYKDFIPEMVKQNLLPDVNFKYVFASCDIGFQKPEKGIYEYVLKNVDVNANEILFIDDNKINLDAAKDLGFNIFWFDSKNLEKSIKELVSLLLN